MVKKGSYQYNFRPAGTYSAEVIQWLKSQKDKPYSLTLLIHKACQQYGPTTDLKAKVMNDFSALSSDATTASKPVSQPISEPQSPSPAPSQIPTPSPKPQPQSTEPEPTNSDDADDDMPNLGFLSHN